MLRLVGLLVIALVCAAPAFADNKTDAEKAFSDGKTKYAAGDYVNAAKDFDRAYKLDPDPAYLFNLAQSYRLAEDCEHALDAYTKFLAAVPNPPNKDAVTGWLGDAKKCVDAKHPKDPPKDPNPPTDPIPKDPVPPKDTPKRSGPPVAAIAVMGVGAIAIVVGVTGTLKVSHAKSDHDKADETCAATPCPISVFDNIDDRGKAGQTREIIGYAVGAAAIGGGVFLWMRHGKAEKSVAVAPTKGGAMVVLSGIRF